MELRKISDEELELVTTRVMKISKAKLLARKAQVEEQLAIFDK